MTSDQLMTVFETNNDTNSNRQPVISSCFISLIDSIISTEEQVAFDPRS